jgi:hypothetical protein
MLESVWRGFHPMGFSGEEVVQVSTAVASSSSIRPANADSRPNGVLTLFAFVVLRLDHRRGEARALVGCD